MSEQQFEEPSDGGGGQQQQQQFQQGEEAEVSFTEPDQSAGEQAAFQASAEMLSNVPDEIRNAHEQVSETLKQQNRSGPQVVQFGEGQSQASSGAAETLINAVAIGATEPGFGEPGKMALHVFTAEDTSPEQVRSLLASSLGVQNIENERAVPIATHKASFETQAFDFKIRPAPTGVSIGHCRVTAGTLGSLATGRSSPRNNRRLIVSNNHVIANSNYSQYGDPIIQPGRYDGGKCPTTFGGDDAIAILERYVPLRYGGPVNYVDAATGWAWSDRVRPQEIYRSGGNLYLYQTGTTPIYPQLGMIVGKSGRTTELTQGRVVYLNWSGWVGGYPGGSAYFVGQFLIQSTTGGNFSAGGDSGSKIWKWETGLPPVGLLFAGGGGYTIASPMPWVTALLDINLS